MTSFTIRLSIVAVLFTASFSPMVAAEAGIGIPAERCNEEVANRDKTGTTAGAKVSRNSQEVGVQQLASGVSFEAEGTRLELATPCGAPHFQCGR